MFNLKTIGRTVDCAREEFEYQRRMRKRGERTSRLSGTSSLPGRSGMAVSYHSLGRWRSIKSVGRIVENEDGVAGVGLEPS